MATAKKASAKKTAAKKSAAKKGAATKGVGGKAPGKKTAGKKIEESSPNGRADVAREMKAMKAGKLKSGSGETVRNPKQAIAIGLSEARKAGKKVPPPPENR